MIIICPVVLNDTYRMIKNTIIFRARKTDKRNNFSNFPAVTPGTLLVPYKTVRNSDGHKSFYAL
jgi:hypothetical protein